MSSRRKIFSGLSILKATPAMIMLVRSLREKYNDKSRSKPLQRIIGMMVYVLYFYLPYL
jgi:hypothetical protein